MTAPEAFLTALHLHQAAAVLPAWLDRAAQEDLGYADFLGGLLEDELATRAAAETQRRLRQAGFPFAATIEQVDVRFRPELKRQVVLRELDPTFVDQAGTLTLVGPPGLGKTMLAICIATKQVRGTLRVWRHRSLRDHPDPRHPSRAQPNGGRPPAPAQAAAELRCARAR